MKFISLTLIFLIAFVLISCKVEDIISELGQSKITAKQEVGSVLNKAKSEFAADAKLASIYGREVNSSGEVDLLQTSSFNAFVYVVQSDSLQENEFYVPVYQSAPVKSPVNFNTMLSFIKDSSAKSIMETVFGTLSGVAIASGVQYDDSPAVISKMLARNDVQTFRTLNPESKIDMFLVPGKSIDTTNVNNTADWIVNFYGDTSSLVLWLHPGTSSGTIDVLSN